MKNLYLILLIGCSPLLKAQGTWQQKSNLPSTARSFVSSFSIGTKGYFVCGYDGADTTSVWEYDQSLNSWVKKADFPGTSRDAGVAFSIGGKGYFGTGERNGNVFNDFWEYDPALDTWTQKASFGGAARQLAVGFSIGNKGYVGTGTDFTNHFSDFWEYDPSTDLWTQKQNFSGGVRMLAVGFSIGDKGYLGTGCITNSSGVITNKYDDLWEYDTTSNSWSQKNNFGGGLRWGAVAFSIDTLGFIATGNSGSFTSGTFFSDLWQYSQSTNTWIQKQDFPGASRNYATSFVIGRQAYLGTGEQTTTRFNDLWEYSDTSSITGIKNITIIDNDFLYPNPSSGIIFCALKNQYFPSHCEVFSLTGQKLVEFDVVSNNAEIDLSKLCDGVYFLTISNAKTKESTKLIVKH